MKFSHQKHFFGVNKTREIAQEFAEFNNISSSRQEFKSFKKYFMAFIRNSEKRRKYVEYTSKYYDDPFKLATDNFITVQLGFRAERQTYFYGSIRDTLQRLFESGILQLFLPALVKDIEDTSNVEIYEKQKEYSTLRWKQLYPGFYIWLAALIVCFTMFIGEIVVFRILLLIGEV